MQAGDPVEVTSAPGCAHSEYAEYQRQMNSLSASVNARTEQGWSLLCNGVIVFDDIGEILPGGRVIPPHCPASVRLPAAA